MACELLWGLQLQKGFSMKFIANPSCALLPLFCSVAILFSGCGKEMKLSVKAAESEKDLPTAALVRKVELTYHDAKGQETLRESFPVLGLSQPVSARSDLLKELKVDSKGMFEARGYTTDGLLMLRGWAQVPENSNTIEIEMNRQESQRAVLGAPLLRRVRLANVTSELSDFSREVREVHAGDQPLKCLEIPPIQISLGAGTSPRLILEAAIKAPHFRLETSIFSGNGELQSMPEQGALKINNAGEAEIEFGKSFLEGLLFKKPLRMILKIHSHQYEGCLDVTTRPHALPMTSRFQLLGGVGALAQGFLPLQPVAMLYFMNPNDFPAVIKVNANLTNQLDGQALVSCIDRSDAPLRYEQLKCVSQVTETLNMAPHGTGGIVFFPGRAPRNGQLLNRALRLDWSYTTRFEFDALNEFPAVSSVNIVP